MKACMLFTGSGRLVVPTSHASIAERALPDKLRAEGRGRAPILHEPDGV